MTTEARLPWQETKDADVITHRSRYRVESAEFDDIEENYVIVLRTADDEADDVSRVSFTVPPTEADRFTVGIIFNTEMNMIRESVLPGVE